VNIKFNEKHNTIDLETIAQIFNVSATMASYDFVVLTLNNRQQRRAVADTDREKYDKLIMDYNLEVDMLLD